MTYEIEKLNSFEINALLNELSVLDSSVLTDFKDIKQQTGLADHEVCEYVVLNKPQLWAKVHLDWEARDYQIDILQEGKDSKKLTLRLGRRLGKTECMCILILWHAYVQPNKGPNNQYDILIITPFDDQIGLIFKRLKQLIDSSPYFSKSVTRDIHHHIELANGAVIHGMTAGSKSGTGAANTRGQRADLIVLDEVDYMGTPEITNILNIRNEAPERIKIMVASTPSGKRENYYKWCTGASRKYHPPKQDLESYAFSGYVKQVEKGNGWVEIYAPSIVNKELLKINPDTEQTYLEDLKDELTDMRFKQEVLAEFGEEEMGIYQKKHIDYAINEGVRVKHRYVSELDATELQMFMDTYVHGRMAPIILGVDWDKYSASTNMVVLGLDKLNRDANGEIKPVFKVWERIEIARGDFTYTKAIDKIIELNDTYDFDWVVVDRGYGETQIELLHQYGLNNPRTNLQNKVIGYQFSEKIKVRDPYTGKMDKKPLKPFMVNNSVIAFERKAMVLNPKDMHLIQQLEQYKIKSISSNGIPKYSSENEHALDAMNLCLLVFEQKYGDLFKNMTHNIRIFSIPQLRKSEDVKDRNMDNNSKIISTIRPSILTGGDLDSLIAMSQGRSDSGYTPRKTLGQQMPSRRKF